MEEPPGDYLTVSMVGELENALAHVLRYIEDCAA
jgi:hypothetical protein